MNTYRVYLLSLAAGVLNPQTDVVYLKADKYGPAWQQARALCSKTQVAGTAEFTVDAEGLVPYEVKRDTVVAKISDMTVRNVKLDKTALQAILDDANASAEDKLAAMQGFLQTGKAPAAPTPEPEVAADTSSKGKGRKAGAEAEGAAA